MKIDFLDLRKNDAPLAEELLEAAGRVLHSGRYLHGEETRLLESDLVAICGGSDSAPEAECVACSNGLDALRLILRGYLQLGKLKPGAEVIVPANTYIASILPITEFGLRPVLCEPDPSTMNIDFQAARRLITPATGAVMTVHLYGTPAWDAEFAAFCRQHGILIIEDNAQAIGAKAAETGLNGCRQTGLLGDAAAFSFYPTKNIGALGDAGAVMTTDAELAAAVRALANYGSDVRYHNIYQGFNCRIDEIQAAMLRVKLKYLPQFTSQRRQAASLYDTLITSEAIEKPRIFDGMEQVWHQYVVRTDCRDKFRDYLSRHGVATDVHYAVPPHLQPCYSEEQWGPYPITERMADSVTSLPIAGVNEEEVRYVANLINSFSA